MENFVRERKSLKGSRCIAGPLSVLICSGLPITAKLAKQHSMTWCVASPDLGEAKTKPE
jgi:hypothetical protein